MTALVTTSTDNKPQILRPLVSVSELLAAQTELTTLIAKGLQDGVDYGIPPGAKKHTLYKPGGERIMKAFGCHAEYTVVEKEVDHDREFSYSKLVWNDRTRRKEPGPESKTTGLYAYTIECKVYSSTGACVGSGLGSCSTMESKYIDRPRDLQNTVLKMAQKRAMIAAVLNTFGLSDRFTQDIEDAHDVPQTHVEQVKQQYKQSAPPQQREGASGYDPQNKAHQDALIGKLTKAGVPEDIWDTIGQQMAGRPYSDADSVIAAAMAPA
jgi:hypothetical protein